MELLPWILTGTDGTVSLVTVSARTHVAALVVGALGVLVAIIRFRGALVDVFADDSVADVTKVTTTLERFVGVVAVGVTVAIVCFHEAFVHQYFCGAGRCVFRRIVAH